MWLRWQRLGDHILGKRLPPATTPAEWRRLINSMVFLFPKLDAAERLRDYPADAEFDQLIVAFETDELVEAGCDIRICRWNNGFPDRQRPPRIRAASDYRSVAEWHRDDIVSEVVVAGAIPAGIPFEIAPDRIVR